MFNLSGEVIGVNTAIYSPGSSGGSVGVGFSVPSNLVRQIVDQLKESGEVRRGWLGVRVQSVSQEIAESYGLERGDGAIVTNVTEGSPAEQAGLQVGDLIQIFDETLVKTTRDLSRFVASATIGEPYELLINRKGEALTLNVTLKLMEKADVEGDSEIEQGDVGPQLSNLLGLKLGEVTDEVRRRYRVPDSIVGVVVEDVDAGADADGKLMRGDVVTEVNFEEVSDPVQAISLAEAAAADGKPVLLQFYRDGDITFRSIRAPVE